MIEAYPYYFYEPWWKKNEFQPESREGLEESLTFKLSLNGIVHRDMGGRAF